MNYDNAEVAVVISGVLLCAVWVIALTLFVLGVIQ